MDNLFYTIMEAEGDPPVPMETPAAPTMDASGNMGEMPMDIPPELPTDGGLGGIDTSTGGLDYGMDPTMMDPEGGDQSQNGGENAPEDNKISEKANNLLNQKLYTQFVNRNSEIEGIVENVQKITPLLSYEVVQSNDKTLNQLKAALSKGQSYVINKFVNARYGENLLFFRKLDALYVLLMDDLNSNLKKLEKQGSNNN